MLRCFPYIYSNLFFTLYQRIYHVSRKNPHTFQKLFLAYTYIRLYITYIFRNLSLQLIFCWKSVSFLWQNCGFGWCGLLAYYVRLWCTHVPLYERYLRKQSKAITNLVVFNESAYSNSFELLHLIYYKARILYHLKFRCVSREGRGNIP